MQEDGEEVHGDSQSYMWSVHEVQEQMRQVKRKRWKGSSGKAHSVRCEGEAAKYVVPSVQGTYQLIRDSSSSSPCGDQGAQAAGWIVQVEDCRPHEVLPLPKVVAFAGSNPRRWWQWRDA